MKPKKTRERGSQTKNLAITVLLFVPVLILLSPLTSQTLGSWEIYNDTDITSGTYGLIDIYDSPPDNTTVNFYGDLADYIGTHDSSTLNMYEGIADVRSRDNSTINIFGGTLSLAEAWNNGTVNFSGDASLNILEAWDFGTLNLTTGSLGLIGVSENGVVNITDGSAEEVWIHDSGVMYISGGVVSDLLSAEDSSAVNVYGYDLVKTSSGGKYGYGQVYGFWNDGTSFTIDLDDVGTYDHINLIPEPASLVFLAFGSLLLRRRR